MGGLTGAIVHGWILREEIGSGGVAEVYRIARHDDPQRQAALKVLLPERQRDQTHVQGLEREHDVLARLSHPGIPKARGRLNVRGRDGMIMDLIPGPTLSHALRIRQPFPTAIAACALVEIVAYLHREQVVHNDIKLENAILGPGQRICLIDFGSSREPVRTNIFVRFFRKANSTLGTAAYLAPELLAGHRPCFQSDVYALGVCVRRLLTGELPFQRNSRVTPKDISREVLEPLEARMPQLNKRVCRLLDSTLDPVPMNRPDDANSLLEGIQPLVQAVTGIHVRAASAATQPPAAPP